MAETPLLLTMMARVNYKRGLPNSRAQLYEEYVKQLLYEWERTKLDEQGKQTRLDLLLQEGGVSSSSLDRALNELAYRVHGQGGSRDTVDIARSDMRDASGSHPPRQRGRKSRLGRAPAAPHRRPLRPHLRRRTREDLPLLAPHLSGISGVALAGYGQLPAQIPRQTGPRTVGEAIFLALGYQISVQSEYDDALDVFFNLMPQSPKTESDWRRVLLLGEAYVRLLGPQRAGEAEKEVVAQHVIRTIPELLTTAMQNRDLPPANASTPACSWPTCTSCRRTWTTSSPFPPRTRWATTSASANTRSPTLNSAALWTPMVTPRTNPGGPRKQRRS